MLIALLIIVIAVHESYIYAVSNDMLLVESMVMIWQWLCDHDKNLLHVVLFLLCIRNSDIYMCD